MTIFVATNNNHKRTEIEAFLSPLGIACLTPHDLGLEEDPAEVATTFSGNALLKAEAFWQLSAGKYPVLADDSGLCVDALNGRPGVFSARYGQTGDLPLPAAERNNLLLREVKATHQSATAHFVTHLCLYLGNHRLLTIEQSLTGSLAAPSQRGIYSFGYDPIFYPTGSTRSLAEYTTDEKNKISARGRALEQLVWILQSPSL